MDNTEQRVEKYFLLMMHAAQSQVFLLEFVTWQARQEIFSLHLTPILAVHHGYYPPQAWQSSAAPKCLFVFLLGKQLSAAKNC